ncbi:hypothetical protein H311_02468, partial [Anncaliia algerae PRA109]
MKKKFYLNIFIKDNVSGNIGDRSDEAQERAEEQYNRNDDLETKILERMLRALKMNNMHYKSFSGLNGENPEEWFNQFIALDNELSNEKMLNTVKSSLKGRALAWFNALRDDEIVTFEDFRNRFFDKYICKSKSKEESNFNL